MLQHAARATAFCRALYDSSKRPISRILLTSGGTSSGYPLSYGLWHYRKKYRWLPKCSGRSEDYMLGVFCRHDHCQLTRAWPGGRLTPPPLPNIRDSSKTNSAIDLKLGRPSHTTIWHRPWIFFWNPSEIFWDMVDFVTSLHATFGRKLAKLRGSVEDAVFTENANGKHQKT